MSYLNILAFGNQQKLKRIMESVSEEGIKLVIVSNIQEGLVKSRNGSVDLVLIDSLFENAETFCRDFYEISNIPVILLITGNEANWPNFCFYKVDGFISDDASNIELVARLKAFARRKMRVHSQN
jgi:DNA-binding response OmpR family regulator